MKYHKAVFSFFLISVLFWNTIYISFTYGYYYVDQSGFIERFCENIDKPEMKCDGKCHLKDVVEKKTTSEKTPINLIAPEKIALFFDNKTTDDLAIKSNTRSRLGDRYFNLYSYNRILSLDQPPEV